jgi:hypothetical protein
MTVKLFIKITMNDYYIFHNTFDSLYVEPMYIYADLPELKRWLYPNNVLYTINRWNKSGILSLLDVENNDYRIFYIDRVAVIFYVERLISILV